MLTPIEQYRMHRDIITTRVIKAGIRHTARKTGLTTMRVSRYCNRTGADDALTHYTLAAAVDRPLDNILGKPPRIK